MKPPLPVTVLTGFLGVGKTTLLVHLLDESPGAGVAVVLNELGVAGTDGVADTSFLELTQGCVCCVRAEDLVRALGELRERPDVQRVVLETTGVADPLALTFVLERPDLAELARLDAVVTVVDATAWARGAEWDMQVAAADLIVLSKLDLVGDTDALRAVIAELNPTARVLEGAPDPRVILDVEHVARASSSPVARHTGYTAVSYVSDAAHDAGAVEDFLESLPPEVYRAKGVVRTSDGRWMSFHAVAGRVQVDPDAAAPAHGETRVVFIGLGLEPGPLRARMVAAAA